MHRVDDCIRSVCREVQERHDGLIPVLTAALPIGPFRSLFAWFLFTNDRSYLHLEGSMHNSGWICS